MNQIMKFTLFLSFVVINYNAQGTTLPQKRSETKAAKATVVTVSPKPIIDSLARKDIEKLKVDLESSKNDMQFANTLIGYTTLIIGVFGLGLAAGTYYTWSQASKMRKLRDKYTRALANAEITLANQGIEIEGLHAQFEKEKNIHLKLIFPVIEGEFCFQHGDYVKALWHYKEAKEISPAHPWLINFNWLLINTGRMSEAIQFLENLIKTTPSDEAKYYLAHAYRRDNQIDIAEQIIKPVAVDSKYPRAIYEYASILLRKNELEKAERMFIEANRYYLRHSDFLSFLNLAITQILLNKSEAARANAVKAKTIIQEDLERTPNNSHLKLQLGVVSLLLDDKASIREIKSSIKGGSLPIENAKSAIDKLEKIQCSKPTAMIAEAMEILKGYYNNNYNEKYYAA